MSRCIDMTNVKDMGEDMVVVDYDIAKCNNIVVSSLCFLLDRYLK